MIAHTPRRLAALVLAAGLAFTSCSYRPGNDTTTPPAASVGDPLQVRAPDFDTRPPTGGPRASLTAGTGTGVSSDAVTDPQSEAAAGVENQFLVLTNSARNAGGVNGLGREPGLDGYARGVAADIAAAGRLAHSNIVDLLGAWYAAAENIGYGPSAAQLQAAFVASPGHRENLMNPIYGAVGIGVFIDPAGRIWVALDFAG